MRPADSHPCRYAAVLELPAPISLPLPPPPPAPVQWLRPRQLWSYSQLQPPARGGADIMLAPPERLRHRSSRALQQRQARAAACIAGAAATAAGQYPVHAAGQQLQQYEWSGRAHPHHRAQACAYLPRSSAHASTQASKVAAPVAPCQPWSFAWRYAAAAQACATQTRPARRHRPALAPPPARARCGHRLRPSRTLLRVMASTQGEDAVASTICSRNPRAAGRCALLGVDKHALRAEDKDGARHHDGVPREHRCPMPAPRAEASARTA